MEYKSIEKFKNICGDNPVFTVHGAISPLFLAISWQEKEHPLHAFLINKDRESYLAVDEKEYIAIANDKFRRYFINQITIDDLQSEYDIWEQDTESLYEKFTETDLNSLSNDHLSKLVKEIFVSFDKMCQITIYIENVSYDQILSVIGDTNKNDLDLTWEKGTEAIFMSFENRRLKKSIDLILEDKKNIARKAQFMFTDYYWTKDESVVSQALKEIKSNLKERKAEINSVTVNLKERKRVHDDWLATLNPVSRKIAEFAQLVMHLRDLRKDPLAQIQTMLAEISEKIMVRIDVDPVFAPKVILYEYIKGIDFLASIKDDIEARKDGCIYIAHPNSSYTVEPCVYLDAVRQAKEILESKIEKVSELKGQIACKGIVKGTVRIIHDPHHAKGFQDGDILITSMTRPEFVSLMRRSGAVVTNEGGITCHAAIVSRELKKPCIIGTRNATLVFKDGDLVEVDADKGIVRIIK